MTTTDNRTFHWTAETGLAACGQRLGHSQPMKHIGNSAVGHLQVAEQYPHMTCPACTPLATARLRARGWIK